MDYTPLFPLFVGFSLYLASRLLKLGHWPDVGLGVSKLALFVAELGAWPVLRAVVWYPFEGERLARDILFGDRTDAWMLVLGVSIIYCLMKYGLTRALCYHSHMVALLIYSNFYGAQDMPLRLYRLLGAFEAVHLCLLLLPNRDSHFKLTLFGSVRVVLLAYTIHLQNGKGVWVLSVCLVCQLLMAYELLHVVLRMGREQQLKAL